MAHRKFTQVQMAAKSGVSQRMISGILSEDTGVSVETLDDAALRSGVATLVNGYVAAGEVGRQLLVAQAERELAISHANG